MNTNDNPISILGLTGCILLLIGILIPSIFDGWSDYIVENIEASIQLQDSGKLVITSLIFTAKYSISNFFIFFGAMVLVNGLLGRTDMFYRLFIYAGIVMVTIVVYNILHHEGFSYIGHLITLSIILFIHHYIPKQKNFYVIYAVILFSILMAMSWMQLIPLLSKLGIGTSDIATSIKIADLYLTNHSLLNTLAAIFFIVFLIISVILVFLVHLLHKQITAMEKIQENEKELKEARIALVESKVYEEINSLVHDLKTPLSTLEGLSSLLDMRYKNNKLSSISIYISRMEAAIQKMNDMISEILYEDIKQPIAVKELLEYVTSHLILAKQNIEIQLELEEGMPLIYINKIRFSRAISNILENAIASLAGSEGIIQIKVKRKDNSIVFQIVDNGPGIEMSHIESIWREGFSTKNSSGIGLSFVKTVVENHNGTIHVSSVPGSHTQMKITLPVYEEGEITNGYNHLSR
ncbi:sensor histidine kinase [Ornithinibacillus xuwenensis]|uniref:histidine kinase n=1 Tax=Ornithinibacillus xuwenensis TaxID=3144668 RepID=A0ABU9XFG9_9BACI